MSASQMRVEDRLAGASNWSPWKARSVFVLEDLELWDIVQATVHVPPATAPVLLAEFRKRNNKAKRTICDAVRDHIIPHLTRKAYAFEMSASLCKLYENSNQNRKMVLYDRLRGIHMLKDESVTSFLGRYTQIRDELGAVGEVVDPDSMVRTTLNSCTKPWGPFVRGIVAREIMPTWERLWDDFVQEETRLISETFGQQQTLQGDEDLALWTKGKKKTDRGGRKGPKFGVPPKGESSGGQKRDMNTVRCFACREMGNHAGQCPKKKKKRQDISAATAEELEFDAHFARECAFATAFSVVTPSSIRWGDRVEEDLLTHSSDSEGAQTQCSWTLSSGVTGPPGTASVLEMSRQRVGAGALEHQRLTKRSGKAPRRLEPHLATETGKSDFGSISGGSYLVRGQVEDLGWISRSKCSW
jgi:hypothetical protein